MIFLLFKLNAQQGSPHKGLVQAYGDCGTTKSWGRGSTTRKKFVWTVRLSARALTAFTQLRTDTTLDLSQKAEKVWLPPSTSSYHWPVPWSLWGPRTLLKCGNNLKEKAWKTSSVIKSLAEKHQNTFFRILWSTNFLSDKNFSWWVGTNKDGKTLMINIFKRKSSVDLLPSLLLL